MHAGKHQHGDLAAGMIGRHSLLHSNSTFVIDDLYPFVFSRRERLLDDIKPRFFSVRVSEEMSPDVARRVVRCSLHDLENAAAYICRAGALLQRVENFCMRVQFRARIAPRARGTASIRSAAVSTAVIPDRLMHPLSSMKRTRGGLSCKMRFHRRRHAEERRQCVLYAYVGNSRSAGSSSGLDKRRSAIVQVSPCVRSVPRSPNDNRVQVQAIAEDHGIDRERASDLSG
jgi:hypothetical protein